MICGAIISPLSVPLQGFTHRVLIHLATSPLRTHLADEVWDAQRLVDGLQSDAVRVVEQRVQLVQQRPLVALTLAGGGRHQEVVQCVAKLAPTTHTRYISINQETFLPQSLKNKE